jgi:hypothetical protein
MSAWTVASMLNADPRIVSGASAANRCGLRGLGVSDTDPGEHEPDREDPDGGRGEGEDGPVLQRHSAQGGGRWPRRL